MIPRQSLLRDRSRRTPALITLLILFLAGLYLTACAFSGGGPTSVAVPTFITAVATTPSSTSAAPTGTPSPTASIAESTATLAQSTVTTAPTTPSCGPPAQWVSYVVRPGDTLFGLSQKTGASVEAIKSANCLSSNTIRAGDHISLPFIPPVDTPIPPSPTAPASCPSSFQCSESSLPSLVISPGGPNDPGFKPCSTSDGLLKGFPWISVETEGLGNNDLQHGQRAYYFACEFSAPSSITAQMIGPGGIQSLSVMSTLPNPDLQMNLAQRVIPWNATCDLPTGSYLLDVKDGNGNQAQLSFTLTQTLFQRILTIPQSGPAGTTFQIYYCGYGAQANQQVAVDFYYGVKHTDAQGAYDFYHIESWSIPINANGWAVQTLPSASGDPARPYLINDREAALTGYDLIWLLP